MGSDPRSTMDNLVSFHAVNDGLIRDETTHLLEVVGLKKLRPSSSAREWYSAVGSKLCR